MMKGQARTVIGPLLHLLSAYTRDHFATEERMMSAAKYPGLPTHRVQHRDLAKKVGDFIQRYDSGDCTFSVELSDFLSDWLTDHIVSIDQKYGPWLNEHGVR